MTLNGFDIANVNGPGIIGRALGGDFIICKTTEGLGFVDGQHDSFVAQARQAGKLVGHYHYAHLGNSATAEADFFVQHASAQPGDVMVLDFEPYGQSAPDSAYAAWILAFCRRVHDSTGARCWLYMNDDMASRAIRAGSQADCDAMRAELPMWKACYAAAPGSDHGFTMAAWQHTDQGGIDQNTFYGDASTWAGFAVPAPTPPTPPPAPTPTPTPPGDDMAVSPDFESHFDTLNTDLRTWCKSMDQKFDALNKDLRGDLARKQVELDAIKAKLGA